MKKFQFFRFFISSAFVAILMLVSLTGCSGDKMYTDVPEQLPGEVINYKSYAEKLIDIVRPGFDMVSISPQIEGSDVIFIVNVARDGFSTSSISLKKNDDTDNEQYAEHVERMKNLSVDILKSLKEMELDNAHVELRVLDDIDVNNYANGNTYEVRSLLEIYDGDVTYDIVKDTSPESFEPRVTVTLGMENALKTAFSYLEYSSFSYQGLINQLEYEKYTHEEAVYAANNCGADWNDQAAQTAASYLKYSSFSREGLIDQLEYEGFTHDQAVYGVTANGY